MVFPGPCNMFVLALVGLDIVDLLILSTPIRYLELVCCISHIHSSIALVFVHGCSKRQNLSQLPTYVMQIVAIRDIIPPPQRNSFNDVYIAYELMDTDLHQIIRSNQALSEEHCQVPSSKEKHNFISTLAFISYKWLFWSAWILLLV